MIKIKTLKNLIATLKRRMANPAVFKYFRRIKFAKSGIFFAATGLLAVSVFGVAVAEAQVFSEGYESDEPLQSGMLVKEVEGDPKKIEALQQQSLGQFKGVVVSQKESPINLYSKGQRIFVASSGILDVLVSNENGDIRQGDYLSISSLAGIAMKANSDQELVIGRAAQDFNATSPIASTTSVNGKPVNIGRIQTEVGFGQNPLIEVKRFNTAPQVITNIATSIAGKPVSVARIWLASVVFVVTSIISGVMVYGGIKNSLVAIGRNPLSRALIVRGLLQVVLLSLLVFITGLFGVYLLLKL